MGRSRSHREPHGKARWWAFERGVKCVAAGAAVLGVWDVDVGGETEDGEIVPPYP